MEFLSPFPALGRKSLPTSTIRQTCERIFCSEYAEVIDPSTFTLAWALLVRSHTCEPNVKFAIKKNEARVPQEESNESLVICSFTWRDNTSIVGAIEDMQTRSSRFPGELQSLPSLCSVIPTTELIHREDAYAPLSIYFVNSCDDPHRVILRARFDPAVLYVGFVRRLLGQLNHILLQLLKTSADVPLTGVITSYPCDRADIRKWNLIPQKLDRGLVHESILELADRNGSAMAVEAWDGTLTRRQLKVRACELATCLSKLGLGKDNVVPILFSKSWRVPVVMMAVLKAGAAFILLDADLPFSRLRTMVSIVEASVIVASRDHSIMAMRLIPYGRVVSMNNQAEVTMLNYAEASVAELLKPSMATTESTAFLVFTSGSSGQPKAVVVEHQQWCSGWANYGYRSHLAEGVRVLQQASYSFVISIIEMLSTLRAGGIVCIPSQDESRNDLVGAIRRLRPNWICLVPSAAMLINPEDVPSLQTLVLAGESATEALVKVWSPLLGEHLLNGYGQCENAAFIAVHPIGNTPYALRKIGKSLSLRFWIVSQYDHNVLLPVGAIGELVVEGYSMARGYLHEREKTRAAFIDAPIWATVFNAGTEGRRWYKTGDLVQYDEDGTLNVIGRGGDAQLKLYGQRIEAAEVEHHILEMPSSKIVSCVIDLTHSDRDDKQPRLTAFVVLHDLEGQSWNKQFSDSSFFSDQDMRNEKLHVHLDSVRLCLTDYLSQKLPAYMIPTHIIPLISLPRTVTGKLSRRAIRDWAAQHAWSNVSLCSNVGSNGNQKLLQTESENYTLLRRIWSKVFRVPENEIHASTRFSEFGDSMKAMLLVSALAKVGIYMKMDTVYRLQSLAFIAAHIDECQPQDRSRVSKAGNYHDADRKSSVAYLNVSDFQEYAILEALSNSGGLFYNFHVDIRGEIDLFRLQDACVLLTEAHESCRLVFTKAADGAFSQHVSKFEPEIPIELLRPGTDLDDSCKKRAAKHTKQGWCIGRPGLHMFIVKVSAEQARLVIGLPHAQFDGFSLPIMWKDLAAAYHTRQLDTRPSFANYLQKSLLLKPESSIHYWRELLFGSQLTPILQKLREEAVEGHSLKPILEMGIVDIDIEVIKSGFALATIMKAAWALWISRTMQTEDVVFTHLIHGRNPEISGSLELVGMCLYEVPIRIKTHPDVKIREILQNIQTQLQQGMDHQLGIQTIIRECVDWIEKAYIGCSYVQHQNVDEVQHFTMDKAYCSVETHENAWDNETLTFFSRPIPGGVELHVDAPGCYFPIGLGKTIIAELCILIKQIPCSLDKTVNDIL